MVAGRPVLELGCGCGLAGMAAAVAGAATVRLTDSSAFPAVLKNAKRNVDLNKPVLKTAEVSVEALDWGEAGTGAIASASANASSSSSSSATAASDGSDCPVVLAADIFFERALFDAAVATIASALGGRGDAFVAYHERSLRDSVALDGILSRRGLAVVAMSAASQALVEQIREEEICSGKSSSGEGNSLKLLHIRPASAVLLETGDDDGGEGLDDDDEARGVVGSSSGSGSAGGRLQDSNHGSKRPTQQGEKRKRATDNGGGDDVASLSANRLALPPFSRLRSGRDQRDHLALVVNGVCTEDECQRYIALAESHGFDAAKLDPHAATTQAKVRRSGRCVVDNMEVASLLWQRLAPLVPPQHVPRWTPVGVHESLRFLKYSEGDYFKPHYDQPTTREADASAGFPRAQRSFLSCILYLNTPEAGGETRFLHPRDETEPVVVIPRTGAALLFDQDTLRHEGCELVRGVKYAIRTDVMYEEMVPVDASARSLQLMSS